MIFLLERERERERDSLHHSVCLSVPRHPTDNHPVTYHTPLFVLISSLQEEGICMDQEDEGETGRELVCLLVGPGNRLVYLRDRSAQTSLRAATLR